MDGSRIVVSMLLATSCLASARAPDPQASALPEAPADIEMLVRQAIEDRMVAKDIPDQGVLGQSAIVRIQQEIPRDARRLGSEAVPHVTGYTFVLRTAAELRAEADRTHATIPFVLVVSTGIAGDTASIALGTDIALPSDKKAAKLCCCVGSGRFNRVKSRWVFERWLSMVCSRA